MPWEVHRKGEIDSLKESVVEMAASSFGIPEGRPWGRYLRASSLLGDNCRKIAGRECDRGGKDDDKGCALQTTGASS